VDPSKNPTEEEDEAFLRSIVIPVEDCIKLGLPMVGGDSLVSFPQCCADRTMAEAEASVRQIHSANRGVTRALSAVRGVTRGSESAPEMHLVRVRVRGRSRFARVRTARALDSCSPAEAALAARGAGRSEAAISQRP
jgi:hypothetical protein